MTKEKPNFGVHDDNDEEEYDFSKNTNDSADKETFFGADGPKSHDRLTQFLYIFKMQEWTFWAKNYLFSAIGYFIFSHMIAGQDAGPTLMFFLKIFLFIDFLLYPITQTLLEELGRLVHKQKNAGHNFFLNFLFYGNVVENRAANEMSWVLYGVYWTIRGFIFMFKWIFSFIIGLIGLAYMYFQAGRLI